MTLEEGKKEDDNCELSGTSLRLVESVATVQGTQELLPAPSGGEARESLKKFFLCVFRFTTGREHQFFGPSRVQSAARENE